METHVMMDQPMFVLQTSQTQSASDLDISAWSPGETAAQPLRMSIPGALQPIDLPPPADVGTLHVNFTLPLG